MVVRRFAAVVGLLFAATLPLTACSGLSRESLERSLAPDPALQPGSGLEARASLPPDFPSVIPQYPGAALQSVTLVEQAVASEDAGAVGSPEVVTRWQTRDSAEQVQQFYQQQFQQNRWQVQPSANDELVALQESLQVRITFSNNDASSNEATPTAIATSQLSDDSRSASNSNADAANATTDAASPQLTTTEFTLSYQTTGDLVSEINPSPSNVEPSPITSAGQRYGDVAEAPEQLRPYLSDLAALGVLDEGSEFNPNEPVMRRTYARWLLAANNRIYATQPDKQIRTAVESSQPAFQDVPASDPDFAEIQGLANAGIIPSPLSGNTTTVAFRPDAPLTREELLLWKVPLDMRRSLPEASVDAVQQTWGFQDAAQIEPKALKAVLADYQNSDLANIRRAFGFTTLFQPKATVTRAEAAAVLWRFGMQGEGISAQDAVRSPQPTPEAASPQAKG
ncbi:S-layer homology domain-containing protein [Leptolyngbya sp. AN02str]|uniref:S-layer homology domain-containing protein n=1 Tax=Leptolyngbya sp. AN02str TaxID=3423363 RepID=UPI003D31883B